MISALNEVQRLVLDSIRKIADNDLAPGAASLDEKGGFPHHTHRVLAENGFLTPLLPQEFGGSGLDFLSFALILSEVGRVCAASALLLIAQADGMLPILHGGGQKLKEKYLGRLGSGSRQLTALAATEPDAGSDLLAMKTRAVLKGDRYIINGQKCFITNGSVADFFSLFAFTDPAAGSRGMSAFVVEKDFPGLSYGKNENKMGMRGSINSTLIFEDLEVPKENLIGQEGEGLKSLLQTLGMSRMFCAAQAVGIAQGALDHSLRYARERVQFGKPIAALSPIQFMIAGMAALLEASRLLTWKTAALYDQGKTKEADQTSALAKFFASDAAMRITTDAVQVHGGYGYMKEYTVERLMRDAKLTQIYTGTNQIMRLVAGRSLLEN